MFFTRLAAITGLSRSATRSTSARCERYKAINKTARTAGPNTRRSRRTPGLTVLHPSLAASLSGRATRRAAGRPTLPRPLPTAVLPEPRPPGFREGFAARAARSGPNGPLPSVQSRRARRQHASVPLLALTQRARNLPHYARAGRRDTLLPLRRVVPAPIPAPRRTVERQLRVVLPPRG